MITFISQAAQDTHVLTAGRSIAATVKNTEGVATAEALDMTLIHLDDLLEDLPEDFNGILAY